MCVSVNRTDYNLELICIPKAHLRKQWIDQMLIKYSKKYEDHSEIILCDKNRRIMVVYFSDCWGDEEGYGIARCSLTDQFDKDTGMAVAFAHFRGYPIPNFI